MSRTYPQILAMLAGALLSWPSLAAEPAMEKDGMLVDHQGMTLYTFDKDAEGMSHCSGECAKNWPPLIGAKAEGKWSLIERDDGSSQWAYDGKPLYTFVMDKKAGDRTGDGKMQVWHVARP
ncbi:COG4315 family predicted lipoprotein [Pseudomonas tohonis]|uniref:COG4315 family predicted lipoprotein n=1 Tax=Pseudomonas tohonis TaxID=2725477 RepID=UPI0021D8AF6B|nr:hypothetical protein [Pseudomonas tohonis]UXY53127.1 hypothetical protein N9L84_00680 [Pseudomonas tohonis]